MPASESPAPPVPRSAVNTPPEEVLSGHEFQALIGDRGLDAEGGGHPPTASKRAAPFVMEPSPHGEKLPPNSGVPPTWGGGRDQSHRHGGAPAGRQPSGLFMQLEVTPLPWTDKPLTSMSHWEERADPLALCTPTTNVCLRQKEKCHPASGRERAGPDRRSRPPGEPGEGRSQGGQRREDITQTAERIRRQLSDEMVLMRIKRKA